MPLLATNDALYAAPEARPLHDVLTCIREKTTIAAAGRVLQANAERHLKAARRNGAAVPRLPRGGRREPSRCWRASTSRWTTCATNIRTSRCPRAGRRRPGSNISRWHKARERYPDGIPDKMLDAARRGVRADRAQGLCLLFPDRPRHRRVRARAGAADPVPGARLGGQFGRLLPARRHLGRSDATRPAVLALRLRGAQRAARHRRRFRARAARGGDAVCLSPLRPPPRRHRRDRHPLPPAQRGARGRQGARPHRGRHRAAGQHGLGQLRQRDGGRAGPRSRLRPRQSRDRAARPAGRPDPRISRAICRSMSAASC